ncbi:FAD binding domain-containing protein [Cladophialophora immunda]|nr:FAD binding domain-containing protein [Cladophialophora immunda]
MAVNNKVETNGPGSRGKILVVGAGYGGLATAIELKRKGFDVEIVEAAKQLTTQGDIIQVGSNASRVMSKWGNLLEQAVAESAQPARMTLFDKSGKKLLEAPLPTEFGGYPVLYSNRGLLQRLILEEAKTIGIGFRFGKRVKSYFEEDDCAGVEMDGERLVADAVIAADGIHSAARKHVIGIHQHPRTSGFAVFRTCFPLERLAGNPLTKPFTELKEDLFHVWLGSDVHAILFITVATQSVVIFCTHKDTYEVEESWTNPGNLQDMLGVVEGWDPIISAAMKAIPPEKLIDWKLLWRDPIRQWVSRTGRITLVGDAAHPHLPTSGQGAAQAIEDAATIGALLDKLGKDGAPDAFRAFEKLRYERTSLTQRMGWETRHRWHQTDWEAVAANPEFLKMPQPMWLYTFDAEKYAYDRCDEAVESVRKGTPFVSTNTPEGHVHEDWTVEMMMSLEREQAKEHFYRVANR